MAATLNTEFGGKDKNPTIKLEVLEHALTLTITTPKLNPATVVTVKR